MQMIPFNESKPFFNELVYVREAAESGQLAGGGKFDSLCTEWFENNHGARDALLTSSCTHALEMMALLINVGPGDEVIMPSYTFVSTANAFALRGATIVFVDIDPLTMNLDPSLVVDALTSRTKAIVAVHYGGVSCDMSLLSDLAEAAGVWLLEDAAQGLMAKYDNKFLGTIGHLGAYSFHGTKNITSGGEGGLLVINDKNLRERAHIIREKGTNRRKFLEGSIDKYSWVDFGSSYLASELQAAYLYAQLENAEIITRRRVQLWEQYNKSMQQLSEKGVIALSNINNRCRPNGHLFYLLVASNEKRRSLIGFLKSRGISAAFHYIPLHSAEYGLKVSRFSGADRYTTDLSSRLLRLPLYFGLTDEQQNHVISTIYEFFDSEM